MKKLPVILATALFALTMLPMPAAAAIEIEDYYYDDEDWFFDDSYEEYYENGISYDDTGTVYIRGGSESMKVGETKDMFEGRKFYSSDKELEIRIVGGIKWTSSDPGIASVNSKGVVTAHKTGSARIIASYYDNRAYKIAQTIRLTVGLGNVNGSLSGDNANYFEISEGKQINLSGFLPDGATAVVWETGNSGTATVTKDGLVTARDIGKCAIAAKYKGKDGTAQTAEFALRIGSKEITRRIREIRITIPAGKRINVADMFYPNYAGYGSALKNVECSSNNTSIIDVRGHEAVALKKGTCTVTINEYNGYEVVADQMIKVKVI